MFLLDTNVPAVVAWASAQPATGQFLSAISILEIELGARLVERRDGTQGAIIRAWIDKQILPHFEGRILAVDTAVALRRAGPSCPGSAS